MISGNDATVKQSKEMFATRTPKKYTRTYFGQHLQAISVNLEGLETSKSPKTKKPLSEFKTKCQIKPISSHLIDLFVSFST